MAASCILRSKSLQFINGILVLFLIINPSLSLQTNDIQSYLDALNTGGLLDINNLDSWEKSEEDKSSLEDDSMETWGIPDQFATVGRLFKYTLPKDLFGNEGSVKVSEIGSKKLPTWMVIDEIANQLLGVPTQENVGKQYYLEVADSKTQAMSKNSTESSQSESHKSKDIFSVTVVEDKVHLDTNSGSVKSTTKFADDNNKVERILCPLGASVTKATIIIDVNVKDLLPKEMVTMIEKLGEHLNMPAELLRLVPVGNTPIFDNSALVAGPGDNKELISPGAFLQWEVGCGNVQSYHMPILQQLEASSGDGSMSKAMGKGIIGWHVTNNRPPSPHRLKRKAYPRQDRGYETAAKETGFNEIYENEEGSGFTSKPPIDEVKPGFSSPTVPVKPTKTRKPRPHKTRKPRPNKTKGRHHDRTRKPKTTIMPTTRVITPSKTVETIMPTTTEYRHKATPTLPMIPKVETESTSIATPPLPDIVTLPNVITTQPIQPTKTKDKTKSIEIETEEMNFKPEVENEIKKIEIQVGDILKQRLPADTFSDAEDGNTRKLRLEMLTIDKYSLGNKSWVQFDPINQTIYGIPLEQHMGTYQYQMMAADKESKMAFDIFEIKVARRPPEGNINHAFAITLDLKYDRFIDDVVQRLDVSNKLAQVYGDKDTSKITITKVDRGSVKYVWTNNTIPTDGCPEAEISKLLGFLINSDDTMNKKFIKRMKPYKVLAAGAFPMGECKKKMGIFTSTPTVESEVKVDEKVEKSKTSDDDQFITTIVPVVVITTMLLIAAIVVCCLYRKKRKGKMSDEDNSTFVSKGIPVIFADELEDKPDPPTKPLIMSEEKPPLPPPEYPRSNSGGSIPSSPGSGHKEPLLEDERYTRPPPVSGGTGTGRRLPKTPNQPSFREPPPYTNIQP